MESRELKRLEKIAYDQMQVKRLPIMTNIKPRPTKINSADDAFGRNFFQMSIVNKVEPELKVAVNDDIKAASITARSKP